MNSEYGKTLFKNENNHVLYNEDEQVDGMTALNQSPNNCAACSNSVDNDLR